MDAAPRITLRQIAQIAGVSHSTVSLSLRQHHSIPEATRKRITALAEKMGYRPDPMLSALNIYRQQQLGSHYQATLAWINGFQQRSLLRTNPDFDHYWRGALDRAQQMGYQIEEFWLHEPGMTSARLSQILRSRQIQGLLLPPMPQAHDLLDLPWDLFSVVAFGYSHEPLFHVVTNAQYRSARKAVRSLYQLGYRSIGMLVWPDWEERTDSNYSSGYHCECRRLNLRPLICEEENTNPKKGGRDDELLKKWVGRMNPWLQRVKPQAVLMPDPSITLDMQRLGLKWPSGTGIAMYSYYRHYPQFAGIYQNPVDIGAAAVNQLVSMIQRNEKGKASCPVRILVEGDWVDGPSAAGRPTGSAETL